MAEGKGESSSEASLSSLSVKMVARRKVRRLEKKLELYDRQIRELMEQDLSLEDMNSDKSTYLKEDLIKRKFMETWLELCQLKKLSPTIKLEEKGTGPFDGTPYPEINRKVERLLKSEEDFPDYWDVAQLIDRANEKHSLGIKDKDRQTLSRKVFKEVGERLKKSRDTEWRQLLTDYSKDPTKEDPALTEPLLKETFKKSLEEGQRKLTDLFEEYVSRQEKESDGSCDSSLDEETEATGSSSKKRREEEGGSEREKDESDTNGTNDVIVMGNKTEHEVIVISDED
ncbi:PREDICTED: death domain-associated protein 6-like [Amphimedon queenslandica]|uniref:Daxx histone-binding domain-containing protein n=1 Tax=Amphimedon queenslandica TaxID=400682 RepID=A0A1X7TTK7_AMPQE|nr:PREDICTED: death domain-associated protein 6-like [Amphimedon queenslandica]|eukprot:XP_011406832.2 PREDICTED: death domain-associated protein 6-like [Amphimedon queenslandica]